jgi:hypothetical protein
LRNRDTAHPKPPAQARRFIELDLPPSNYKSETSFKAVFISEVNGFDDISGINAPQAFRVFAGDSTVITFDCESKQIVREVERKSSDVPKAVKKDE